MPLFHWPTMPRRSCGVRKNEQIRSRSPRWFGGTSPALVSCMCCVSTTYQWRMGDAHAAHMAYERRCHCVWCRVWEPDHCVSTAQVAYAQRTPHVRAAINAILWRMAGVWRAYVQRMGCVHAEPINTSLYIEYASCECDIKCPVEHIYI